ncbi:hypothetical protein VHEMI00524 [[Torrubiella] hemipterigena]|uniref:Uncharacterized protein n=1 Tax=[Torrubiella] hemipterigena TaxID=1531966 RepID=A0A0A1T2L0_9HYPO|nr:hypothetical protein VHEMI00524 [[Torrubiella] hemipterigena]
MKMQITDILAALALAATISAAPAESAEIESAAPAQGVGCYQQGTPRKPAICAIPNCPGGYRPVFWDFGCPDDSWKCCV